MKRISVSRPTGREIVNLTVLSPIVYSGSKENPKNGDEIMSVLVPYACSAVLLAIRAPKSADSNVVISVDKHDGSYYERRVSLDSKLVELSEGLSPLDIVTVRYMGQHTPIQGKVFVSIVFLVPSE